MTHDDDLDDLLAGVDWQERFDIALSAHGDIDSAERRLCDLLGSNALAGRASDPELMRAVALLGVARGALNVIIRRHLERTPQEASPVAPRPDAVSSAGTPTAPPHEDSPAERIANEMDEKGLPVNSTRQQARDAGFTGDNSLIQEAIRIRRNRSGAGKAE